MADLAATNPKLTSGIEQTKPFAFKVPAPSGAEAGDVFQIGSGPVVAFAQTDRDDDGYCIGMFSAFFAEKISVTAEDGSGDSAVAVGDVICLDGTVVNKDTTNGTEFGVALETVTSGESANIWVAWIAPKHA